jgi:hypothetical protein
VSTTVYVEGSSTTLVDVVMLVVVTPPQYGVWKTGAWRSLTRRGFCVGTQVRVEVTIRAEVLYTVLAIGVMVLVVIEVGRLAVIVRVPVTTVDITAAGVTVVVVVSVCVEVVSRVCSSSVLYCLPRD